MRVKYKVYELNTFLAPGKAVVFRDLEGRIESSAEVITLELYTKFPKDAINKVKENLSSFTDLLGIKISEGNKTLMSRKILKEMFGSQVYSRKHSALEE